MTAALHLAHVHQPPPGPQRKRKGGGGGDGYDDFVTRVYRDGRLTLESRELLLLLAWLYSRDPERVAPDGSHADPWGRANEVLGFTEFASRKEPVLAKLVDADRPRYEPDYGSLVWQVRACSSPMIRRSGQCGQPAVDKSERVDPVTGWKTPVWYCGRHRELGRVVDAERRAMERPEPMPNAGGFMPSYFHLDTGDAGWRQTYEWASQWRRSRWEPPKRYSLRADDWPLPGRESAPEPFRLRLAAMDGELIGGEA